MQQAILPFVINFITFIISSIFCVLVVTFLENLNLNFHFIRIQDKVVNLFAIFKEKRTYILIIRYYNIKMVRNLNIELNNSNKEFQN